MRNPSPTVKHWGCMLSPRRAYGCRKILRCAFWSENPKQKVTFLSPESGPGKRWNRLDAAAGAATPSGVASPPALVRFHRLHQLINHIQQCNPGPRKWPCDTDFASVPACQRTATATLLMLSPRLRENTIRRRRACDL